MSATIEKTISYTQALQDYGVILATNNTSLSLRLRGPVAKMTEDNIRKLLAIVANNNIKLEKSVAASTKRLEDRGSNPSYDTDLDSQAVRTSKETLEALKTLRKTTANPV